jgi:hypothetical protein
MSRVPRAKSDIMIGDAGRRLAIRMAVAVGCLGVPVGLWNGWGVPRAFYGGACAAVGGLAGWMAFRAARGRGGGHKAGDFTIVGQGLFVLGNETILPAWYLLAKAVAISAVIGAVFGLLTRGRKAGLINADVDDPLHGPESS